MWSETTDNLTDIANTPKSTIRNSATTTTISVYPTGNHSPDRNFCSEPSTTDSTSTCSAIKPHSTGKHGPAEKFCSESSTTNTRSNNWKYHKKINFNR